MAKTYFNTRISLKHDTTANWDKNPTFVPMNGEIVVYDDYKQIVTEDGTTVNLQGLKIGNGKTPVASLPFFTDKLVLDLSSHISNSVVHITQDERNSWNNKVTTDTSHVVGEVLEFTKQ